MRHSTYQLIVNDPAGHALCRRYWQPLEDLGCTFERADAKLIAIDVPPEVDVHRAYAFLEAGETDGVWNFEEGHCGHLVAPPKVETT